MARNFSSPAHRVGLVRLAAALSVVAGLSFAGAGTAAAARTATAAKATGTPIVIGGIVSETGPVALAGGFSYAANALRAWTNWTNSQGGLNGHPIKLIVLDDTGVPATQASDARQLVADHAAAVFDSDQFEPNIAPYLAANKVAYFAGYSDGLPPKGDHSWFDATLGPPYVPLDFVLEDKDGGATKIGNAVCSEVAACLSYGTTLAAFAPKVGMKAGATTAIAEAATDSTAQCLAIIQSGANAINMFIGTNPIGLMVKQCPAQGYKGVYNTASVVDVTFQQVKGPFLLTMQAAPWWGNAAPTVQFRDVMNKYHEDYRSWHATDTWTLLQLFAYGMKAKGPAASAKVTGSSVISAMQHGVKNVTLGGLLPEPVTITTHGQTTIHCFYPSKVANGVYSTLSGSWASGNGQTGSLKSQCVNPADV